jgi:hypothetical protein
MELQPFWNNSRLWLWIPGSRFARPGMTIFFVFHEFVN